MEIKMSGNKDDKPKTVLLFHISQSLFKNKRLKRRRLAGKINKKAPKKRSKPKSKKEIAAKKEIPNGRPSHNLAALFSETIEIISTEDEQEEEKQASPNKESSSVVETSIVLSSGDEDEVATQARIFPMLTNQTTVQTEVGNSVFELSLTQLRDNLQTITKKKKKRRDSKRLSKRLKTNNKMPANLSISLLSDDEEEEEQHRNNNPEELTTTTEP